MHIYRSRAPLRISFAGGGTDLPPYCIEHGGQVMSSTIDKYVHITVVFDNQPEITIHAYDLQQTASIPIGEYRYNGKFDLFKAVLKYFSITEGCDIHIHSDLPAGSGMGTSSSLTVALIGLFALVKKQQLSKDEIAQIACNIERVELNETGGYQDQYAAAFGGFNFITFGKEHHVTSIKVPELFLDEFEQRVILCYTGKTHVSAAIQQQVIQNAQKLSFQEGMEKLKKYAVDLRDILQSGNMNQVDEFGLILHSAWLAKQQLSDKISTSQIDLLYINSREHGAIGGKLLGAGGGGFLFLFSDPTRKREIEENLKSIGGEIVPFHFEFTGVKTWQYM